MAGEAAGHTSGAGPAGTGSSPEGTGTPTVESLQAQLKKADDERTSLQQSVQGLARQKAEFETREQELRDELEDLQAGGGSSGTTQGGQPSGGKAGEFNPYDQTAIAGVATTAIKAWWAEERKAAKETSDQQQRFAGQRQTWLAKAEEDFPEFKDGNSALRKKALEVLQDANEGLAVLHDGEWRLATPNAEYLAASRAAVKLARETTGSGSGAAANATFASAGGGTSGNPGGAGQGTTLSDVEFLALAPEARRQYQQEQFERKQGT